MKGINTNHVCSLKYGRSNNRFLSTSPTYSFLVSHSTAIRSMCKRIKSSIFGYACLQSGYHFSTNLQKCIIDGFYCSSCKNVSICISTKYEYMNQMVQVCPDSEYCYQGRCTNKNPLCDGTSDIPFKCNSVGLFPDPFDCQSYHYCVEDLHDETHMILKDYKKTCKENDYGQCFGFDLKTKHCSVVLPNNGLCKKWPVPLCSHVGQTSYLEEDKRIYFVCEYVKGFLYPNLFSCPFGKQYDSKFNKCQFVNNET